MADWAIYLGAVVVGSLVINLIVRAWLWRKERKLQLRATSTEQRESPE